MLLKTNTLLKTILAFVLTLSLVACENDRDDEEIPTTGLEGTYKLTTFTLSSPIDYNNDGVATTDLIEESGCYDNSDITLFSNGIAKFRIQSIEIDYIPEDVDGNLTTVVECYYEGPEMANYSFSSTTVTFSVAGESISFTRSGNALTYVVEGEDSLFGDVVLVFEKQ